MGEAWNFLLKLGESGNGRSQDFLEDTLSFGCHSFIHSFNPEWLSGVLWVAGAISTLVLCYEALQTELKVGRAKVVSDS